MTDVAAGLPEDLSLMLHIAAECGFNYSVIDVDGAVYGWLAHTPRAWPKTDPPTDGMIEVHGGDQLLFKVRAMAEVRAYIYGVLVGFCGGDVAAAIRRLEVMGNADPYDRAVELHKLGWCPIWNAQS